MSVKLSPMAIVCPVSGMALIYIPIGQDASESLIYRLSGEMQAPVQSPGIHVGMYFQGASASLQERDLAEEYPFPVLHEELRRIQKLEGGYLHLRMCIDPDVTLKTRLELCEEIKDDFEDEAFRAKVLGKIQEKLPALRVDLDGLPTEGDLGRIFASIKGMMVV